MIIGENRAQVIKNIKAAVKKGKMHAKVELGDPILTKDERIKLVNDYWKQQKKLSHKFKNIIAQTIINLDTLVLMAHTQIKNKHRAKGPQHGAIVTTNHFKQTDSLPIKKLANRCHKKLYVVIEDSNLKLPGFFGFLMNNINAIPIVQSYQYLGREFPKHLQKVFDKKGWVLIYPEQEMWYNYRKPRPLQKVLITTQLRLKFRLSPAL